MLGLGYPYRIYSHTVGGNEASDIDMLKKVAAEKLIKASQKETRQQVMAQIQKQSAQHNIVLEGKI